MPRPQVIDLPGPVTGVRVVGGAPGAGRAAAAGDRSSRPMQIALGAELEDLGRTRRALEHALAQATELHGQMVRDAEAHLVDLVLAVARKVLAQEIQAGRYEVEPIVREALGRVATRREVVVHLNPDDLARLEAAPADGDRPAWPVNVRLVGDPTLGRAECRLETAEGTVEARVEDQLEQVRSSLSSAEA